jgi:hypothetical protein
MLIEIKHRLHEVYERFAQVLTALCQELVPFSDPEVVYIAHHANHIVWVWGNDRPAPTPRYCCATYQGVFSSLMRVLEITNSLYIPLNTIFLQLKLFSSSESCGSIASCQPTHRPNPASKKQWNGLSPAHPQRPQLTPKPPSYPLSTTS